MRLAGSVAFILASSLTLPPSAGAQQPTPSTARVRLLGQLSDTNIVASSIGGRSIARAFAGAAVAIPPRTPAVAVSRQQRNLLWILPAQGNATELYAVDTVGHNLGNWRLSNAENTDWTALALGRCDQQSCVYVGDLGDSLGLRGAVQLYRFEEPLLSADRLARSYGVPRVQRLDLHYPDGHHDARAMTVDPDGSVLIATSGREGRSRLYRVPPGAWRTGSANPQAAGSLDVRLDRFGAVSGLSRWSTSYAARGAGSLVFFQIPPGSPGVPRNRPGCELPQPVSSGLGLDWLDDHRFVVSTVDPANWAAPLYAIDCAL